VVDFDRVAGELGVYERVLQVLTGETSRLQELMRKFGDSQQQHKANLDSLHSMVSCSWFKAEKLGRFQLTLNCDLSDLDLFF